MGSSALSCAHLTVCCCHLQEIKTFWFCLKKGKKNFIQYFFKNVINVVFYTYLQESMNIWWYFHSLAVLETWLV